MSAQESTDSLECQQTHYGEYRLTPQGAPDSDNWWWSLEAHEEAGLLPPMRRDEFELLVDSIRTRGFDTGDPIVLREGKVFEGRERFQACLHLAQNDNLPTQPVFTDYATAGSPLDWLLQRNLDRRHLSPSQRAAIGALLAVPISRERRRNSLANLLQYQAGGPDMVKLPHRACSVEEVAKRVGVSASYVTHALKLKRKDAQLFDRVWRGAVSLSQAEREYEARHGTPLGARLVKQRKGELTDPLFDWNEEGEEAARVRAMADAADGDDPGGAQRVETGSWWRLGEHLLYCGDSADPEFAAVARREFPKLAFADPPYNAGAASWDHAFEWRHDWLEEVAGVVAVTPGISAVQDFMRKTAMQYRWSASCYILNGMTRGGMGFSNWIYVALFAQRSVFIANRDIFVVTINPSDGDGAYHKGRKPLDFMRRLVNMYTEVGDAVVDPFLGSGSSLIAAHQLGRRCIGAEIDPTFCSKIIARWEMRGGTPAVSL